MTNDHQTTSPTGTAGSAATKAAAAGTAAGPSRRRNPRGEGDRLRAELIAAASQMLAAHGDAEEISLRGVAAAVGVTAPSIYRHFPDKTALLRAVVEQEFASFTDLIRDTAAATGGDPFEALRQTGRAYYEFGTSRPGHYRVLFGEVGLPADIDRAEENPGAAAFAQLVHLVEACVAQSADPHRHDPLLLAVEAWAFVHGLVDLQITCPGFSWPDANTIIDAWSARLRRDLRE